MATNKDFIIKNGLVVGGVLIVNSSGELQGSSLSGAVTATSLQLGGDANPTLTGDGTYLKITTGDGYIDIGAGSAGFLHITTDRPSFYFNKKLVVNEGIVQSYDEDLNLNRAGSTTARLRITAGTTISDQTFNVTGNITVSGTIDGRDVATDGTKLDTIETSATADQTNAEIRAAVEAATDSNVFTDADHSKLNAIEASATADQTAAEILTAIKTVDGAGSGLDADLLDGISSGSFLRSDADDTYTGNLTVTGNINQTGALTATTKSFDIEHPSKKGMRLHHGVLEGPEHSVYVRGKSKEKVILLPDYWVDLVHEDTITIQLTAIGSEQDLYVEDIKDNKVFVNGDNYFYYIQAERKDVDRFEVEYEV
jgi:hypothetical protein